MKKLLVSFLAIVLTLSFAGCADTAKQDAIIDYVNNDVAALGVAEEAFLNSYASVTGDNYTDDETMYVELTENTIILARELSNLATDIAGEITDTEILEVHKIYMNASNKYLTAMGEIISALEAQDYEKISVANETLGEANNLMIDFAPALKTLAEANGVIIE